MPLELNIQAPAESKAPAPIAKPTKGAGPKFFQDRFPDIQAILDQALNSDRVMVLRFKDSATLRRFRLRLYKVKNRWRDVFLKNNGGYTPRALDPANLRNIDQDLLQQIQEAFPDAKRIQTYHWQSPYQYIVTDVPEGEETILYIYNSQFTQPPTGDIISVEFLE